MSPEIVHAVISDVANAWTVTPRTEITLEANPTSVEAGRFAGVFGSRGQPDFDRSSIAGPTRT